MKLIKKCVALPYICVDYVMFVFFYALNRFILAMEPYVLGRLTFSPTELSSNHFVDGTFRRQCASSTEHFVERIFN